MTLELVVNDEKWLIGLQWFHNDLGLNKKRNIRHFGAYLGQTHSILTGHSDFQVGYFSRPKTYNEKKAYIGALNVAYGSPPRVHYEIEVAIGSTWVVALNEMGLQAPYSDTVIPSQEIENFRERYAHYGIENIISIEYEALETFLSQKCSNTFSITPNRFISKKPVIIGLMLSTIVATSLYLYTSYENDLKKIQIQKEKERYAHNRRQAKIISNEIILPNEWLNACLQVTRNVPLFHNGWALRSWNCEVGKATLFWESTGGSMTGSPKGTFNAQGTELRQELLFSYHKVLNDPSPLSRSDTEINIKDFFNKNHLTYREDVQNSAIIPYSNKVNRNFEVILEESPSYMNWDKLGYIIINSLSHKIDSVNSNIFIMKFSIEGK